MSDVNCTRKGCKDVFHSYLVRNASFESELEIPRIKEEAVIPNRLIPFSKAVSGNDYDCWVHFYQDDVNFERIWNNPKRYLPILKKYNGVISPDFSLYRDMPLVMQQWNTYRNRALGAWLQENNIHVIPNIRWGDDRTFSFCCAGAPKNSIISIGSHGCIKVKDDRKFFVTGLEHVVKILKPNIILVYGSAPDSIFEKYRNKNIKIVRYNSEISYVHPKMESV